ncbi:hypothetical protein V3C99_017564 [Haemonchus contortus]
MPATWTKYTLLPCYLHLSIYDDECAAENSIRFPDTLHLDHPSLEQISIKRVKSVEKGCVFPSMGLIFIRGQLFEKHIENLGKTNHGENSGTFECVQMIRQQADAPKCRKNITRQGISDDGYLIFAYKTMEDMCTKDFAASWKTWTGARQLCQLLPDKYMVKRLSFFKKVHGSTQFAYLLIAQIADLMMDCAPALNVLNCLKPKICAFVGAYRIVTFKVDAVLCNALGLSEDQHLYMYTSSLKVNYSNHTAFASYPGYNEFRSEDEKKQVTKPDSTEPESNRKSSETQTDPVERPTARRTLPRTISIYDFPSMKNSSTITHKGTPDVYEPEPGPSAELQKAAEKSRLLDTCDYMMDKKASPIPVALVHPLPSSPTGVWVRKKPPRKVGCVMFENKFPFPTKEPEVPEKSPEFDRRDAIERLIVDLVTDPKDEDKSAKEVIKSPRRAHSEARTNVERRKLNVPDDDSLLQRLKLNYFNSPDYTSAELREINSD